MANGKHILKVGAWTGISRILGFARDVLIANVLGAGRLSDIFLAAFKLPNLFRDLLGEGALSVVFVPMFCEKKNCDTKSARDFANNIFSWLMLLFLGITIIGLILMPVIVWILTPGFAEDPGKLELTVIISRIMFCYLIFVCGTAFLSSILNAFSQFAIAAAMPALLNVFMIGGLLLAMHMGAGELTLYIMGGAVALAGIAQFGILWARLRQKKFGMRLIKPKMTQNVKIMFKRLGISILGSGFYQINIIVGTLIASFQAGAVSWLYYTDRIVQLPFAIIGLAAGTVLLTSISNAIANKKMDSVYAQQNSALRQSMMFTLPCVAGLLALAVPIITVLFEHGAWTHQSTINVAMAIMIQCLVLPAMTTSQIYSKTLYAAQDVKTPVRTSVIALGASTLIYVSLFWFVGYLAIPIGTVISGYIKNALLARACIKRDLFKFLPSTKRAITAFIIIAAVMGAGLWAANTGGLITGVWTLAIAIAIAGMVYLPMAFVINKKI